MQMRPDLCRDLGTEISYPYKCIEPIPWCSLREVRNQPRGQQGRDLVAKVFDQEVEVDVRLDQLVAACGVLGLLDGVVKNAKFVRKRLVVFEQKLKLIEDGPDPGDTRSEEFLLLTLRPSAVFEYFVERIGRRIGDVQNPEVAFRNVVASIRSVLEVGDCAA